MKDLFIGHIRMLFEVSKDNLEVFKQKSANILKQPIVLSTTNKELPHTNVPNTSIRHMIVYLDGSFYDHFDVFDDAKTDDDMGTKTANMQRLINIMKDLEKAKNYYNPKGFSYLLTRNQYTAAGFAAAAHRLGITVVQLEPEGFKAIDEITDEKKKVETVISRLQNQLRLRGSGPQLRSNVEIADNQVILTQDL